MRVNNLPKVVSKKRNGRDLNPRSLASRDQRPDQARPAAGAATQLPSSSTVFNTLPHNSSSLSSASIIPQSKYQGARSHRSTSAIDAGAQQQTHQPQLLLSIDGTDRQTDGRPTVTQTLLCTMRAASIVHISILL